MSARKEEASNACFLSNQKRYKVLQDAIFSNYGWLNALERELYINSILIRTKLGIITTKESADLNNLFPAYIILLSRDKSRDVVYLKDIFFNSLQPYKYNKGTNKINFNSGIILNITNILFSPEIIPIKIEKLLLSRGILYSTYLFQKCLNLRFRVLELLFISLIKLRNSDNQVFITHFIP